MILENVILEMLVELVRILTGPMTPSFFMGWYGVLIIPVFILYQKLHPKNWTRSFWKRTSFNIIFAIIWGATIWFVIGGLMSIAWCHGADRYEAEKQRLIEKKQKSTL
jgi:hypothetical protein